MGNIAAKRQTKVVKKNLTENRNNAVITAKERIDQIEQKARENAVIAIKSSQNNDESQLVLLQLQTNTALLQTAKKQLDRNGAPFTKADLIAIILFMRPEYIHNIDNINRNTVEDLNAIIRITIYNPELYTQGNTQGNTIEIPNTKLLHYFTPK